MNFIDRLKTYGAVIQPDCLDAVSDSRFVLTRDSMTCSFLFMIRWNTTPSVLKFDYNPSRLPEIVKYISDNDFKITHISSTSGRRGEYSVTFINSSKQISITLGESTTRDLGFDYSKTDESEEDEVLEAVICYSAHVDYKFVFDLMEKFVSHHCDDNMGKVLIFEKNEYGDIVLIPHKVKEYQIDISENYNDDFLQVHSKISKWTHDFSANNNKLLLLHGEQGSGKTNYIKHLMNTTPNVKKIYIPPFFLQSIADPAFFPIIKKEKESILIIEDAEKILINREDSNSDASVVSILLNLCDGIMADVLNFKIIATFNTDESRIDKALKRKGRMFLKYKFDALSKDKTKALFEKVHKSTPPKERMTLAEIYNDENEFGDKKPERKVGFGV